jgi:bzd-type benzoyl-CoA reductase Q subunit
MQQPEASPHPEYWRWAEGAGHDPSINPRAGAIVSAGVDVGSVSSQAVICVEGKLYAYANVRTGASSPDSARKAMAGALAPTGLTLEDLHYVVGTGYGRVNVPFAQRTITEIHCHARAAHLMFGPKVRTILDMGGQDCKVIRCDASGKVVAFQMNDKCASGTGRGLEVFADLLQIPIDQLGPLSLAISEEPPAVSSTCVVFAKSEASSLLRQGWPKEKVLAAYCGAMAHRVYNLLERVGVEREFAITGGIAKNPGVVKRIERELGFAALKSPIDAQIAGALGAAVFGFLLHQKNHQATSSGRPLP